MIKNVISLITVLICSNAFGQVRLPRLISDSMILQRDTKIKIWGWASVREKINVDFNNKSYTTAANSKGAWFIIIPPMHSGGPYDMHINATNKITIKDILIGDVWICSGQSNMELPMQRIIDKYEDIIEAAKNPNIRQFNVSTKYNFKSAQEDFSSGSWESATPQSVLRFTAVGYFFAKSLYKENNVPIGIIKAAVGGSPAEAWLSEDALLQFPEFKLKADTLKNKNYVDSILYSDSIKTAAWYKNIWQNDKGLNENIKWFDTSYNASSWNTMQVPSFWKDEGLNDIHGVVWFKKSFYISQNMLEKTLRLFLGTIVDRDSVYINGIFIGATQYQYPPRKYLIPKNILHEGINYITVRIINYGNTTGGFTKDKSYKIFSDSDSVNLSGTWQYKIGVESNSAPQTTTFNYMPGGLYNAMIAPLTNFSIKGVAWYQGESNVSRPNEYKKLFPALINNWRSKWQHTFPFLYVQLANFMQADEQPSASDWAQIRQAQLQTLSLPKTGMAVTIDIGEWNDIHPLNKEDVGNRLALAAQKIAYKKNIVYSGPLYKSMKIKNNKIIISFNNKGSGLVAKNGNLQQFAIAGTDKKFIWANAVIHHNKVIVWSNTIQKPVAVRYAWANNPQRANLYNKENLPASPFTTEK